MEKIDSRIRLRISVGETLIECGEELGKVGGKSYEGEMDAKAGEFVKKEAEGKFRCKECEKVYIIRNPFVFLLIYVIVIQGS